MTDNYRLPIYLLVIPTSTGSITFDPHRLESKGRHGYECEDQQTVAAPVLSNHLLRVVPVYELHRDGTGALRPAAELAVNSTCPLHLATPLDHPTRPHHTTTTLDHTTRPHHLTTPCYHIMLPPHTTTPYDHSTRPQPIGIVVSQSTVRV